MTQLLLLDLLEFPSLGVELLSDDSAFLEVVQSVLLFDLLVLLDLGSELVGVLEQDLFLLLLFLLFSLSFLLLLLDDSQELVSFLFCLFGQKSLFFLELSLSRFCHLVEDLDLLFLFLFLFKSG